MPQQAARSIILTWSHSPVSSSPHLCPTLFVLRNSGPARPGPSWPASLHRSRQPGRRSPGGNQGSSAPQQAARSLSLTWSHSQASVSHHLCTMLLVLRNSCPSQPGPSWPAALHQSRRPGRRSSGDNQGSSLPQPHQAARSLSLSRTRDHSLSPSSPFSAQHCSRFVTPGRPSLGPQARRVQVTRIHHFSSSIQPGGLGSQPGSALSRSYPRLREDAEFYWVPPASLCRSRQPGRRSPRSRQGSPASHLQQATRSLRLTRGHPPGSGSPRLCPTLLTLRNPGPAQFWDTLALGPGRMGSSCGSSSRSGGPNCQPSLTASGSHS
ncbi:hypothetical protein NDU88_007392 [Pleurodeles waltl]|uniref:Uncharacterized protein n=1 Tax=Pleurodeles waltl TaxID=8319 RepID=A0AAV7N241_PLEWA|nr:hypothetical protein NDU88_007392 [Pleurodeles waltl]